MRGAGFKVHGYCRPQLLRTHPPLTDPRAPFAMPAGRRLHKAHRHGRRAMCVPSARQSRSFCATHPSTGVALTDRPVVRCRYSVLSTDSNALECNNTLLDLARVVVEEVEKAGGIGA
jgi:hypothetical protein